MNSSPTFLKLIISADFWELNSEWFELPANGGELKTGFIKHTDLRLVFKEPPEDLLTGDDEMNEVQYEPPSIAKRANSMTQKRLDVESRILDLYFFGGARPSVMCTSLKVDKRYVYKVVEQTKKALLRLTKKRDRADQNRKVSEIQLAKIKAFWNAHRSKFYRVEDVWLHLKSKFPQLRAPSPSFIAGYMKTSMNLSYKKVSWRPLKILSHEMINLKLSYIDFVESAERIGFKILQIDEFSVSRAVWPLRAWTEKGKSGYVAYEGPPSKRYSIIAAIIKAVVFSNWTRNSESKNRKADCFSCKSLRKCMKSSRPFISWTRNSESSLKGRLRL